MIFEIDFASCGWSRFMSCHLTDFLTGSWQGVRQVRLFSAPQKQLQSRCLYDFQSWRYLKLFGGGMLECSDLTCPSFFFWGAPSKLPLRPNAAWAHAPPKFRPDTVSWLELFVSDWSPGPKRRFVLRDPAMGKGKVVRKRVPAEATLEGLWTDWEKDAQIRRESLAHAAVLQWPSVELTGHCSVQTLSLNRLIMWKLIEKWVPQTEGVATTCPVDLLKEQVGRDVFETNTFASRFFSFSTGKRMQKVQPKCHFFKG